MSRKMRLLESIDERLRELEHKNDVMEKILLVKEPGTPMAADAFEGLRKQVVNAATARRNHLVQLVAMAVAVRRATSVDDLEPQVRDWMHQAEIAECFHLPPGYRAQDLFEHVDGGDLAGVAELEIIEPAYLDGKNGIVLRLGRARPAAPKTLPGHPPAELEPDVPEDAETAAAVAADESGTDESGAAGDETDPAAAGDAKDEEEERA